MGPDPTRAYFWSAVNKRLTHFWPRYFLTWPKENFLTWRENIRDGPWPNLTRAYFWPTVNKRPTRLWPGYFPTQLEQFFLTRREKNWKIDILRGKFQNSNLNQKCLTWPEPQKIDPTRVKKFWPGPITRNIEKFDIFRGNFPKPNPNHSWLTLPEPQKICYLSILDIFWTSQAGPSTARDKFNEIKSPIRTIFLLWSAKVLEFEVLWGQGVMVRLVLRTFPELVCEGLYKIWWRLVRWFVGERVTQVQSVLYK